MMNFRELVSRECLIDKNTIDVMRDDVEDNCMLVPSAAEREAIFTELMVEKLEAELEGFDADIRSKITLLASRRILGDGCLSVSHLEALEIALSMEGDSDRIIRNIIRWAWKRHQYRLPYESIERQIERKAKIAKIIAESRGEVKKAERPKQSGNKVNPAKKTMSMADRAMAAAGVEKKVEVIENNDDEAPPERVMESIPLFDDEVNNEIETEECFQYHVDDLMFEEDMTGSFDKKGLLDKLFLPKLGKSKGKRPKLIKRVTSISGLFLIFLLTSFWGASGVVVSADGLSFAENPSSAAPHKVVSQTHGDEPLNPKEGAGCVPVLLYHRVLPDADVQDSKVAIGVSEFTAQMQWLKKHGYKTVSCREVVDFANGGIGLPEKSVLITFDDGYVDNLLYAYPILKKMGMHAAIFAITDGANFEPDAYDATSYPLQKTSFSEMDSSSDVFEYGSHTNDLHSLREGGISSLLSADSKEVLNDLIISKKLLDTDYFSYPYGQYREQTIDMVKQVGYKASFTTSPKSVLPGDNPYLLGRYEMHNGDGVQRVLEIVSEK